MIKTLLVHEPRENNYTMTTTQYTSSFKQFSQYLDITYIKLDDFLYNVKRTLNLKRSAKGKIY